MLSHVVEVLKGASFFRADLAFWGDSLDVIALAHIMSFQALFTLTRLF